MSLSEQFRADSQKISDRIAELLRCGKDCSDILADSSATLALAFGAGDSVAIAKLFPICRRFAEQCETTARTLEIAQNSKFWAEQVATAADAVEEARARGDDAEVEAKIAEFHAAQARFKRDVARPLEALFRFRHD